MALAACALMAEASFDVTDPAPAAIDDTVFERALCAVVSVLTRLLTTEIAFESALSAATRAAVSTETALETTETALLTTDTAWLTTEIALLCVLIRASSVTLVADTVPESTLTRSESVWCAASTTDTA